MKNLVLVLLSLLPGLIFGQWSQQTTNPHPEPLKAVYFIDENIGWAGGGYPNSPAPIIFTLNGGLTWEDSQSMEICNTIFFIDENVGWYGGGIWGPGGRIYKTENGSSGINTLWQQQELTAGAIQAIFFVDDQIGWAVETDCPWHCYYSIMNTTDGGLTWVNQIGDDDLGLYDLHFINENQGWAVGSDLLGPQENTLLRTIDGGQNWNYVILDEIDYFSHSAVHFTDSLHGWIVGANGNIIHTTDGGEVWNLQASGTVQHLIDMYFLDQNNGWVVGYNGTILNTIDGGQNWESQESGTNEHLRSVFFTDLSNGWAVGDNFTILHTDNGGINRILRPNRENISLSIYPNPIQDNATIDFDLKSKSQINISLINTVGAKIYEIYSAVLNPGRHYIDWSPSQLKKGIYILKVETEYGISTIKVTK